MTPLLSVKNLRTHFNTERGIVRAVNGISYDIQEGEIVGLVGESGSGKSVSQLSVLQLIQSPPGEIISGSAVFEGKEDLLQLDRKGPKMRSIRGRKISMIFQEPMTSLNPALTIARQMSEVLQLHLKMNKKEARDKCLEFLNLVGIPDPNSRIDDYPHQFSGGMRQRVMIAMAMLCNPKLLIADEVTTALDATIQAQLLELMNDMVDRFHSAMVLITHNLGIVARYADRVLIMYAGQIVESGTVKEIWSNPCHPYTIGLLKCIPRLGQKIKPIKGTPPNLINIPPHCAFLPRCPYITEECYDKKTDELKHIDGTHYASCHVETGVSENGKISK